MRPVACSRKDQPGQGRHVFLLAGEDLEVGRCRWLRNRLALATEVTGDMRGELLLLLVG